jgi:hypothetical protein
MLVQTSELLLFVRTEVSLAKIENRVLNTICTLGVST